MGRTYSIAGDEQNATVAALQPLSRYLQSSEEEYARQAFNEDAERVPRGLRLLSSHVYATA